VRDGGRRPAGAALDHQRHAHPLPKEAAMSRPGKPAYTITGLEIDLEAEVILDSLGRRVDQASVDWALVESGGAAHDCVEPGARGG